MYKLVTMNPLCVDAIETMNANAVCKNDGCNEKIQGKKIMRHCHYPVSNYRRNDD